MTADRPPSPYRLESPPTSSGRVLLAQGFHHYCLLHWGLSGEEIAEGFGGAGGEELRRQLEGAANLLGGLFAGGVLRAWARPFGGGELLQLRPALWELDDHAQRFRASALDPARPFDPVTPNTHWIFADRDEWNAVMEASVRDTVVRPPRRAPASAPSAPASAPDAVLQDMRSGDEGSFVRLPDVIRRTGMSRSTIYRKMEAGRFPRGISLSDNLTAWRESELDAWIARPS